MKAWTSSLGLHHELRILCLFNSSTAANWSGKIGEEGEDKVGGVQKNLMNEIQSIDVNGDLDARITCVRKEGVEDSRSLCP